MRAFVDKDDGYYEYDGVDIPEWAKDMQPCPLRQNSTIGGVASQIAKLEASITPRRMRESILGIDNGWMANVDAQIATLRLKL